MSKRKRETIALFARMAGVSKRTIERDLAAGLPHITRARPPRAPSARRGRSNGKTAG